MGHPHFEQTLLHIWALLHSPYPALPLSLPPRLLLSFHFALLLQLEMSRTFVVFSLPFLATPCHVLGYLSPHIVRTMHMCPHYAAPLSRKQSSRVPCQMQSQFPRLRFQVWTKGGFCSSFHPFQSFSFLLLRGGWISISDSTLRVYSSLLSINIPVPLYCSANRLSSATHTYNALAAFPLSLRSAISMA